MYMTILSGQVAPENHARLQGAYSRIYKNPPEGLLESYLVHGGENQRQWQIVSVWRSRAEYERAHAAGQADLCVQMFCDAGSTPERMGFQVSEHYQRV